jgi:hypothetical protein
MVLFRTWRDELCPDIQQRGQDSLAPEMVKTRAPAKQKSRPGSNHHQRPSSDLALECASATSGYPEPLDDS